MFNYTQRENKCMWVCMFIYKIRLCITGEAALPKQAMLWDAPIRFTWLVSRLYPDWRSQHRAKEGLGTKRGKELSNFKCSCTPISFKMQINQHGWSHLDKKKNCYRIPCKFNIKKIWKQIHLNINRGHLWIMSFSFLSSQNEYGSFLWANEINYPIFILFKKKWIK